MEHLHIHTAHRLTHSEAMAKLARVAEAEMDCWHGRHAEAAMALRLAGFEELAEVVASFWAPQPEDLEVGR